MAKNLLEAFSDGVFAIVITVMVLELKTPNGTDFASLLLLAPTFLSYILSFVYIGIYWNNHHHLLQFVKRIDGRVLWANTHLLFWLSLVPLATAWCGQTHFAELPVILYGFVLLMAALAYFILTRVLLDLHEAHSELRRAIGKDVKGKLSALAYALALPLCLLNPYVGLAIYVAVGCVWLVPDRRVEKLTTST